MRLGSGHFRRAFAASGKRSYIDYFFNKAAYARMSWFRNHVPGMTTREGAERRRPSKAPYVGSVRKCNRCQSASGPWWHWGDADTGSGARLFWATGLIDRPGNSPYNHAPRGRRSPSPTVPPLDRTVQPLRSRPGAQVAQLVEQGTENPRVGGSTPSLGTILVAAVPCTLARPAFAAQHPPLQVAGYGVWRSMK